MNGAPAATEAQQVWCRPTLPQDTAPRSSNLAHAHVYDVFPEIDDDAEGRAVLTRPQDSARRKGAAPPACIRPKGNFSLWPHAVAPALRAVFGQNPAQMNIARALLEVAHAACGPTYKRIVTVEGAYIVIRASHRDVATLATVHPRTVPASHEALRRSGFIGVVAPEKRGQPTRYVFGDDHAAALIRIGEAQLAAEGWST